MEILAQRTLGSFSSCAVIQWQLIAQLHKQPQFSGVRKLMKEHNDWAGWSLEQPGLVEVVSAHGREVERDEL